MNCMLTAMLVAFFVLLITDVGYVSTSFLPPKPPGITPDPGATTSQVATTAPEATADPDEWCRKTISPEQNECGIAGTWKNQLKSIMRIKCNNGQLQGRYNSAVGNALQYYELAGRYTMSGPNNTAIELGWAVAWNNEAFGNSNSTAAWSGIYYTDEGIIHTQWILTHYEQRKNLWKTSWINHDEFKQIC